MKKNLNPISAISRGQSWAEIGQADSRQQEKEYKNLGKYGRNNFLRRFSLELNIHNLEKVQLLWGEGGGELS